LREFIWSIGLSGGKKYICIGTSNPVPVHWKEKRKTKSEGQRENEKKKMCEG